MGVGRRWVVAAVAIGVVPLAGCSGSGLEEPECSAMVGYADNAYRPTNGLQTPRRGASLGERPYLGCDGEVADELGTLRLYEVAGEDPEVVVLAAEHGIDTVYYNDAMEWSERPDFMRESEHYLTCTGPGRFTGEWRWVEPEDMPDSEDYDSAHPPYTANFETSDGVGVGLDTWAKVALQAEVTDETAPLPDADLLRRAMGDRELVRVTLRCDDGEFEVARIRIVGSAD